jgi:hypothetical protein
MKGREDTMRKGTRTTSRRGNKWIYSSRRETGSEQLGTLRGREEDPTLGPEGKEETWYEELTFGEGKKGNWYDALMKVCCFFRAWTN